MSDPVWYRSLYWRIALGFIALLAALLAAQGLVFLWMTGRMVDLFPNRSPAQFANTLAADVGALLSGQPGADIDSYLNGRYASVPRGFVIALDDGRLTVSRRVPPPPSLVRATRGRLFDTLHPGGVPPIGEERRGRGAGGGDRGRRFFGDGFGQSSWTAEYTPVFVRGRQVGLVGVAREPPPLSLALRALGPTLAVVALVLLVAGTAVAALVIARPTHRRLRGLQHVARAIGAGDTTARAPESGGDEVTLFARAFNEMAGQLEQRTHALEDADRTRRQLLADVSHELMTPLAAIRGYVETLGMADLPLDEATRARYLQIVNEETERLEHIIGDLLDLARLEGGGGALRIESVAVAHLLDRIRDRHDPVVRDQGIALRTTQDATVETIPADPNRLEQALQNLVANAIRHTPEGGTVDVHVSRKDDLVVFTIEDTGSGIAPEHLPHVFDRFYKADESRTGTAVPSGSGLGLSIVQAIVARHGGTVSAENVPGGGARFTIALPADSMRH
ncbi:MAG TPA: HAMP domain-containing sensor histidine kinase [Vicinamibacterales bacterium]|jgi:signal transduction histidine kinase|nr:HAMP domain-containing sensor histidine kinase [Vicinamibacterales bacterium]